MHATIRNLIRRATIHRDENAKVQFLVRGKSYETRELTLDRFPDTLLGQYERRQRLKNPDTHVIEVDCSYGAFDAILFYYQSHGLLARPPDIGMEEFLITCQLFEIEDKVLRELCVKEKHCYVPKKDPDDLPPPIPVVLTMREKFWKFLEDPTFSIPARIYAITSVVLVVASTILQLAVTEPDIINTRTRNLSDDPYSQIELALNTFFLSEYVVRFLVCWEKRKFVFEFENVIDLFAVFPYFFTIGIDVDSAKNLGFIRAVRTIRVLRVLRFSKQSETLSSVVDSLKTCVHEFLVLLMCLFVICCLCGSTVYYLESIDDDTQFISIPHSMWWAIQTVVCLGYGDIIPQTFFGRLFAMSVAIFGVLTLSIPLLFLGSKYVSMATQVFNVSNTKLERVPRIERNELIMDTDIISPFLDMSILCNPHHVGSDV